MKGMIGYPSQIVETTIRSARYHQLTNVLGGAVQNGKPEPELDSMLKSSWIEIKDINYACKERVFHINYYIFAAMICSVGTSKWS